MRANLARSMGVQTVEALDHKRAHELAGNAMHLFNVATVILIALSCFKALP